MKVTTFTKAKVVDFTGQPDQAPYLYAVAYFSDGYHAAFDFRPQTRKVTMRRKDGAGWTYNDRPSRARIEAILAAVDPIWTDALAEAERLHADQVAWNQERAAFFMRRSASEPLHAACAALVAAAEQGQPFDEAIQLAANALAIAAGENHHAFVITDRNRPGVTHKVRHASSELAFNNYRLSLERRPAPSTISVTLVHPPTKDEQCPGS